MKESKAVLSEASSLEKFYSEYELFTRPIWFKGSRDRGLREDIAEWNEDFRMYRSVYSNRL